LLVVIIAAVGAYYVSNLIPPVYQAKTTVLVDMAPSNKSLDYSTLMLSSQLTQTYSQMLTKSPVLEEVASRLGLLEVDQETITAKPVSNTSLINIFVDSADPILAANIANTLVEVFADQVNSLQEARFSASQQSLQAQMADIDEKIKLANEQLEETTNSSEKDRLESTIANYSQTYAGLLQSYEQVRLAEAQTLSSIVQIEPASRPGNPIRPRIYLNIGIAALVTALLVGGLIVTIDLLNDTVKTPEEIIENLGLPVLGVISHHRNHDGIPITEAQPLSPIAESFRTLRTNVKYAGASLKKPLRSIIVTSAMPGEGKTEVVINLGVVMAQNKLRVLLMDADLRRPSLHRRLKLDNMIGLSQIFVHPELGFTYSLQPTRIKGVTAITAGHTPPNPSELLGSQLMGVILDELKDKFDILLIDTPPALATDAAVMLQFVKVFVVIKPGTTHGTLRRLVKPIPSIKLPISRAVLNDINLRSASYGYYYKHYKYYNGYSSKDVQEEQEEGIKSILTGEEKTATPSSSCDANKVGASPFNEWPVLLCCTFDSPIFITGKGKIRLPHIRKRQSIKSKVINNNFRQEFCSIDCWKMSDNL
jgi:non-specific protein-tyrosine kinase